MLQRYGAKQGKEKFLQFCATIRNTYGEDAAIVLWQPLVLVLEALIHT